MIILIVAVVSFLIAFISSRLALGKTNAIGLRIPMLLLSALTAYIGFGSLLFPILS